MMIWPWGAWSCMSQFVTLGQALCVLKCPSGVYIARSCLVNEHSFKQPLHNNYSKFLGISHYSENQIWPTTRLLIYVMYKRKIHLLSSQKRRNVKRRVSCFVQTLIIITNLGICVFINSSRICSPPWRS